MSDDDTSNAADFVSAFAVVLAVWCGFETSRAEYEDAVDFLVHLLESTNDMVPKLGRKLNDRPVDADVHEGR